MPDSARTGWHEGVTTAVSDSRGINRLDAERPPARRLLFCENGHATLCELPKSHCILAEAEKPLHETHNPSFGSIDRHRFACLSCTISAALTAPLIWNHGSLDLLHSNDPGA